MGKLYFRYGVMSSAKSATLLTQHFSLTQAGFPVMLIKPSADTRSDRIESRIKGLSAECTTIGKDENVFETVMEHLGMYVAPTCGNNIPKWVLADECQFFTAKQIDELRSVADNLDINVMCYGLRTDFRTNLFEGSKRLMEIADTIDEIKLSCPMCGSKAIVNARYDASTDSVVTDGEQIVIGDGEYVPMCHKCYRKRFRRN